MRRWVVVLALGAVIASVGGCATHRSATATPALSAPTTLRLGYFPNLTHATAIVGVSAGTFERALSPNRLTTTTFTSGPTAVEALFSNAIDAAFVGPNPAINAFVKSHGKFVIISGATSGGSALVVRASINGVADLKGKKLATPQLGNTQDVALRFWLQSQGLQTDASGGGDVTILPEDNAQTVANFTSGAIDGAWVPEPWASVLRETAGAKVLVNEASLWPNGKFATTELVVNTDFAHKHPEAITALLRGVINTTDFITAYPQQSQALVIGAIKQMTGKKLSAAVVAAAWKNLVFTVEPITTSLQTAADHAVAIGLLPKTDLTGIVDVHLLNSLLSAAGKPSVR